MMQPANSAANQSPNTIALVILDILKKNGALTQEQYDQVKLEALSTGTPPETLALQHNFATPVAVTKAKAEAFGIPFIDVLHQAITPEALTAIPEIVARRYTAFPVQLDKEAHSLTVAMENPLDLTAVEFIQQKSGFTIIPALAVGTDIIQAIDEHYAQSLSLEVTEALKDSSEPQRKVPVADTSDQLKNSGVLQEAPVAKIVETILQFAVKARASDVHLEPQEEKTRVRYRIDGILQEKLILPRRIHDAVISRIKILSGMKIDEKRLPQDGRFTIHENNEEVDLRVSSLPTVHGEKIVMRLLKKTGIVPDLPELGLRGRALKNLMDAVSVPHGIILITGPTGSGKTTTLYSILHIVNKSTVNIVTLEDPVEYQIPGINQVQVNPQAGLTFSSGLRSFLRQDPNIIMVGEIRDTETVELAIQASLTGHLVFSTLHTSSAAGALPRLLDMHAEPFLISSSVTCVAAQRVVRTICAHCKETFIPPEELVADIRLVLGALAPKESFQLYRGKGCEQCADTGYLGRIAIFEVLPISEKISKFILERRPAADIERQAASDGMILMKQDGYLKALGGLTTIEEVLRVAQV